MSYNPDLCVATGVHKTLAQNLNVQLMLGNPARLYDNAPEDPTYPFLTYGAARCEDIGGDDSPLTAHTLSLHLWSRYGGRSEALGLIGAVRGALEDAEISFEGCHLVSAHVVYTDVFRSSDGRTLHGVIRVNIRTQPLEMEAA